MRSFLHPGQRAVEPVQDFLNIVESHRRTEAVMTRRAAVIMGPAGRHAKGAEHFIEDQQDPVVSRQPAERGQELGSWKYTAGVVINRLADDRGQLGAITTKGFL